MTNRPAARARREIRRAWLDAARANAVVLLVAAGAVTMMSAALFLQPIPLWARTFELGLLVAGSLSAMAWIIHVASGMHGRHMGRIGEVCTATTVVTWRRRRRGWALINGLYFANHGDVDHVLVGPGGVFAIESKWTSTDCQVDGEQVLGIVGREPVAQARAGADKVELLLRYGRSRLDVTVRPVVILWGPGAPSLADGFTDIGDVLICEGRRSRKWLPVLDAGDLAADTAEQATTVLQAQLDRQAELPVDPRAA